MDEKRLKIILQNALSLLKDERLDEAYTSEDFKNDMLEELGITEEEYAEITKI